MRELRILLQTGGSRGVFLEHSGDDLTSVYLRNLCWRDKLLWILSVKPSFQITRLKTILPHVSFRQHVAEFGV